MLLGFAVSDAMAKAQDDLKIDMVAVMGDLCYAGLSSAMPRLNITKEDEFEHVSCCYIPVFGHAGTDLGSLGHSDPAHRSHKTIYGWCW